jgi:hypothetical protein
MKTRILKRLRKRFVIDFVYPEGGTTRVADTKKQSIEDVFGGLPRVIAYMLDVEFGNAMMDRYHQRMHRRKEKREYFKFIKKYEK